MFVPKLLINQFLSYLVGNLNSCILEIYFHMLSVRILIPYITVYIDSH